MKKFLSLLLAAVMLLGCIPAMAAEAPDWKMTAAYGAVSLRNRTKVEGHITVPAEVDGVATVRLDYMCFAAGDKVTGVTIPDAVRYLDRNLFSGMDGLTELTLPRELMIIRSGALSDMDKIESLVIPPAVSLIQGAILKNKALQSITFEGVCPVFLPDDSFATLHDLHPACVIYVPDDQLDAYKAAFADDPEVLGRIQPSGKNAVVIDWTAPESDFEFDASTGTITAYKGAAYRLHIPAAIGGTPVRAIGKNVFQKNYHLYYVTIPEGVETVGSGAFQQANGLSYIELPATLRTVEDYGFGSLSNLVCVRWSEGLESIGKSSFSNHNIRHLELPASLRVIGEKAFASSQTKTLIFGGNLETIGKGAFSAAKITSIQYKGHSMPQIDPTAFEKITQNATITFSEGCPAEVYNGFAAYMTANFPSCTAVEPVVTPTPAPAPQPAPTEEPAAVPAPQPAAISYIPATEDDYIGGWVCSVDPDIQLLLLGGEATMIHGSEFYTTTWSVVNGVAEFDGMKLYTQEDWSGLLEYPDGEIIKFERGYVEKPKATPQPVQTAPDTEIDDIDSFSGGFDDDFDDFSGGFDDDFDDFSGGFGDDFDDFSGDFGDDFADFFNFGNTEGLSEEDQALLALLALLGQGMDEGETQEFSFIDTPFVLTSAVSYGVSIDPSAYGEYKVCLRSDGKADLIYGGSEIPSDYLTWKQEADGSYTVEYSVMGVVYMTYVFKPEGNTLKMDFYGTDFILTPAY